MRRIGAADPDACSAILELLPEAFGVRVREGSSLPQPDHAWDPARRQYSAMTLLRDLLAARDQSMSRILGITEVDLFIPTLTFVYGQAQLDGPAAVLSLARLRQEFYGLPPNPTALLSRSRKEAVHELGHTFGLLHCPNKGCPMSLSTDVSHIDSKGTDLCPSCRPALDERLSSPDAGPLLEDSP